MVLYYGGPGASATEGEPHALGSFSMYAANAGALLGVEPLAVQTAEDIVDAILDLNKLAILTIGGYGTSTTVLRPGRSGIRIGSTNLPAWISVEDFANLLARRLTPDFVISFGGCRAAANPGEVNWELPTVYGPGGERSWAGKLRDALVRARAPLGEVRAHAATGSNENPSGRTFVVDQSHFASPGQSVMDLAWGAGAHRNPGWCRFWGNRARGPMMESWIAGGPVPPLPRPA